MCIYNVAVVLGYFQLRDLSYEFEWRNNSYFHSFSEFVTILWSSDSSHSLLVKGSM